jgi:trk system potassium uptake protein TrkA
MNIVILGAGQVGSAIANQLSLDNENNITLIDTNQENLDNASKYIDINTITGNASHPSILERAGIESADMLIAVTISDETNMLACQMAHTLYGVEKKIARIRTSEYLHKKELFTVSAIPIDFVITPENIITNYLERMIEEPGSAQVFEFENGLIQLVETRVFANSPIVDSPINDLSKHLPNTKFRVVSINRKCEEVEITGDTIIRNGDKVFFVTEKGSISKVLKEFRRLDREYRNIIIAGGGRVGFNLAKILEKTHNLRIIEKNRTRARKIEEQLNNTLVLNGSASDEKLLLDEGIANADLFIALTDSDEINVIVSILAKKLGAHKTISLVKRNIYEELANNAGEIDMVLSPDQVTSGGILSHIRKGNTMMVHSMHHNKSEAIEVIVDDSAKEIIDKSIKNISLPKGVEIGSIVRNDELIMPTGNVIIRSGDHVLFIITDISKVGAIENIIAGDD